MKDKVLISNWHRNSEENDSDMPRYKTHGERKATIRENKEKERAARSESKKIKLELDISLDPSDETSVIDFVTDKLIAAVLGLYEGKKEATAFALGISPRTLRNRLKKIQ